MPVVEAKFETFVRMSKYEYLSLPSYKWEVTTNCITIRCEKTETENVTQYMRRC